MTPLQLKIYEHVLKSRLVQSCLRGHGDASPHLVCIGALKKLCNSPSLIYDLALKSAKEGLDKVSGIRATIYEEEVHSNK